MKRYIVLFFSIITAIILLFTACETKPTAPQTDNIFDRLNPDTGGDPFDLTANIANGGVTLTWNSIKKIEISTYRVYRSEIETSDYKLIASNIKNNYSYIDKSIENGHSYWYRVSAIDANGNESALTNTSGVNILTDPVLVINGGDESTQSRSVQLTIIASSAKQIMLSNNSSFMGAVWENYVTSKDWMLESGIYKKYVYMKISNDSTESNVVSAEITPQKPLVEVSILDDKVQYTKTRDVKVMLMTEGKNLTVKLSEDSSFTGINWQQLSSVMDFVLTSGDGPKRVYAIFKNDFDFESSINKDDIILDTKSPVIAVAVTPDSGITNETQFSFNLNGSRDDLCPNDDMKIRFDYDNNGEFDTQWLQFGQKNHVFAMGGGDRKVKVELQDKAGWKVDTTVSIFINTRPQANFTTTKDENDFKKIYFDASSSSDYENGSHLKYRWDFDGDNQWDTEWLTEDTISYQYFSEGQQKIALGVIDKDGLTYTKKSTLYVSEFVVEDVDGNEYPTVKIGGQYWMATNLKVTHYRNGDAINYVTDIDEWVSNPSGAYCMYNNNDENGLIYGNLYNYYTITDNRKIAPEGWHIPTIEEWQELRDYLGGETVAGSKLKEEGTEHWGVGGDNPDATNSSGFTALGGGYRNSNDGKFVLLGEDGFWWSASLKVISLFSIEPTFFIYETASYGEGCSVRCIKDK